MIAGWDNGGGGAVRRFTRRMAVTAGSVLAAAALAATGVVAAGQPAVASPMAVTQASRGSAPASAWHRTAQFPPVTASLAGNACGAPADCVAITATVSSNGLLGTTNGGKTWTALKLPSAVLGIAAVACHSAADCQAMASLSNGSGVALGTTNGGRTWTTEALPVGDHPFAVACGSALDCQAAGISTATSTAVVLGTSNGGKTWANEKVPSGTFPNGVACGSATACQIVGDNGVSTAIFGTSNGGKTWAAEPVPAGVQQLTSIACASAADCEATGAGSASSVVIRTTTAGKSWAAASLPPQVTGLNGISCGSATACQIIGLTTGSAAAGHATGSPEASPAQAGHATGSHEATPAQAALARVDPRQARQAAARLPRALRPARAIRDGVSKSGGAQVPAILGTTNDGKTWAAETVPGTVAALTGISCGSAQACQAVAEGTASLGVPLGTTNGGKTWAAERLPLEPSVLAAIGCAGQVCQAVGTSALGAGVALGSSNAGQAWTPGTLPGGTGPLAGVACGSPASCQAVGTGSNGAAIVATANGGKSWTAEKPPSGVAGLTSVTCGSAASCQAVGQDTAGAPVIVGTTNGGKTWATEKLGAGWAAVPAVSCGSATACLAIATSVGGGPAVLATGNGGKSWTRKPVPARLTALTSVSCGSAAACQVTGVRTPGIGVMLGTMNAGAAWRAEHLPPGISVLGALSCASAKDCAATGATFRGVSVTLSTPDGGNTWTRANTPPGTIGLSAIACTTAGCQAAGWDSHSRAVLLHGAPVTNTAPAARSHPAATPASLVHQALPRTISRTVHPHTGTPIRTVHLAPHAAGTTSASLASTFRANSITWESPTQGWVLGSAPCGSRTCTDVIGTVDGGRSWVTLGTVPAPIPLEFQPGPGVTEVRFASPETGWAFGPGLYRTTNGGHTWAKEAIPGGGHTVLDLAASATEVYAIVSPCVPGGGRCAGKALSFWRAPASGGTWTQVKLNLPSSQVADVAVSGKTVYVVDPQEESAGKPDKFYASLDGGETFTTRPVPCDSQPDVSLLQVVATSPQHVALLCDGNPGLGMADKFAFRSSNTAKTDVSAGTLGSLGINAELAASPLGNLAVASSSAPGSFLYTNDSANGTNWSLALGYGDGGIGWNDITYTTDADAWAIYAPVAANGPGKIYASHDGALHWNVVVP